MVKVSHVRAFLFDPSSPRHQGTCIGLDFESGVNTFWAPDVFWDASAGVWHMYVTFVRRVRVTWGGKQMLAHLTSGDLAAWSFQGLVEVAVEGDQQRRSGLTAAEATLVSTELLVKVTPLSRPPPFFFLPPIPNTWTQNGLTDATPL